VLLVADRAFLFVRGADHLDGFERELRAYEVLASSGLDIVPRLLGRWHEQRVHPFPFAAVSRLRGAVPNDAAPLFDQLGAAIASWHELDPPSSLPFALPAGHEAPHQQWLRRALDPATTASAVAELCDQLGDAAELHRWTDLLGQAAALDRVLVHGDVHEDQLLADGGRLTGVLDWETARLDHPFWDFDLGEWGTGLWRRHRRSFNELWSTAWGAYCRARPHVAVPADAVIAAFRLRQVHFLLRGTGADAAVVGSVEEHVAALSA